jgi:hypothetical protein
MMISSPRQSRRQVSHTVGPLNTNIGGYRVQLEIRENTFDTDIVTINYAEISSSGTPLVGQLARDQP